MVRNFRILTEEQKREKVECKCGCGSFIDRYDKWKREKFYIFGHGKKGKSKYDKSLKVLCSCGCGKEVYKYSNDWKERKYLPGHHKLSELEIERIKKLAKDKIGKTYEDLYPDRHLHIKKKISSGLQGINLENWQKFISYEAYSTHFNKNFKRLIRERDGYACLKCNLFEPDAKKLYNKNLTIHHINYIKKLTIKENCCALCLRCNTEVNGNRKQWTKFFQSILSERYGYKYDENGNCIINTEIIKF